jgi:hypothetical protein
VHAESGKKERGLVMGASIRNSDLKVIISRIRIMCITVLALCLLLPVTSSADPLDNWHWRSPLPTGNNLRAITYANNTFVSVGDAGTVISSPDGVTWTTQTCSMSESLSGIAYGNGAFVVVGTGGTILTSADGVTWTERSSGTWHDLVGITYGNGTFVAVGSVWGYYSGGSVILTSPDGVNWTERTSGITEGLAAVTYGNNTFVAVGWKFAIVTSPDGVNWTKQSSGTGGTYGWTAVTYANNLFVATGNTPGVLSSIHTSPDGVTWTYRAGFRPLYGVAYGSDTFVAVGDGAGSTYAVTSSDGIAWTRGANATGLAVTYGNGKFVAVGLGGSILTSPDGVAWTDRKVAMTLYGSDGLAIIYAGGTFVLGGSNIFTSPDGVTWTQRASGSGSGIAYGNGTFVAVGSNTFTSPDGVTWTPRQSGTGIRLSDITYGNGQFVAVGYDKNDDYSATILTSPDGVAWTKKAPGTADSLWGIIYGNGMFVAVGPGGTVLTSPDAVTWTTRVSGTGDDLRAVAYGNNVFVAVGGNEGATILTSPDGVTWNRKSWITYGQLHGITYANDTFVTVGDYSTILVSADGQTWEERLFSQAADLSAEAVAYGADTFVVVGSGSRILQSDPLSSATTVPLTVTESGSGSGTVTSSPPGINCGSTCNASYPSGSSVTLSATPSAGSTLTSWTGCDAVTGNVCTVTVNAARSVTVLFTADGSFSTYFDTVQKVFIGYYQRPADPGGLLYWAGRLNGIGGNLNEIIEAYANSPEARSLYGTINSSTISYVVNSIYNTLFGRGAEPAGLTYYVNGFDAGQFTAATIMLNILNGAQGGDLQSVNNKLAAAYQFTTTIDPELDGMNFQVTYAGQEDVIAARSFLASVTEDPATVWTPDEVTTYMKDYIADPGDPILNQ